MMRKGGAEKMLNEYFDRECERIYLSGFMKTKIFSNY